MYSGDVTFHAHGDGLPCNVHCWTLGPEPGPSYVRTRRLDHNHLYQVEEPMPNCPACGHIRMDRMDKNPYQLYGADGGWK